MTHCPVSGIDCPDMENCYDCLEWATSCDRCCVGGHSDSGGFLGYFVEPGVIRTLCKDCYELEGGDKKAEEMSAIFDKI